MTTKKKVLGRSDFLAASTTLKRVLVEVPDLGGSVYIRELSARQILEYNDKIKELSKGSPKLTPSNSIKLMALLLAKTICDEAGTLLFTEEDVEKLADNRMDILLDLSIKSMEASGLNNKAVEEVAANLKKVQKNSSATT